MNQICSGGKTYSTGHLAPFTQKILLPLRGGCTKVAPVEFHFTPHCFTAGLADGETVSPGCYWFEDGSQHLSRPRVFDLERYDLSIDLPSQLRALIASDHVVSRTERRDNIVRVDKVLVIRNGISMHVSYYILMHPTKIEKALNSPAKLKVTVESAYPEKVGFHGPNMKGSRPFAQMLGEYW